MRSLPILAAVAALPGMALATAPDGRPVRNSFIDRPVADARDLVRQVRADPVVADRYERHFSMDRAAVLRFLGTLHRARLARAGTFTIYSVPTDGHIKMHVGRIPKGEPMFMDRAGRPVLVVRCGNPVVLGPSYRAHAPMTIGDLSSVRTLDLPMADALDRVPLALVPGTPESEILNATSLAIAGEPAPETQALAREILLSPKSSGLEGLSLMLPILGFLGGHGSHAGSGSVTPPPVPEPAPFLALAGGVAALARRRRK